MGAARPRRSRPGGNASTGRSGWDGQYRGPRQRARKNFKSLLNGPRVDMVLSGHFHHLIHVPPAERESSYHQVIAPSHATTRVEVTENHIEVAAVQVGGKAVKTLPIAAAENTGDEQRLGVRPARRFGPRWAPRGNTSGVLLGNLLEQLSKGRVQRVGALRGESHACFARSGQRHGGHGPLFSRFAFSPCITDVCDV